MNYLLKLYFVSISKYYQFCPYVNIKCHHQKRKLIVRVTLFFQQLPLSSMQFSLSSV